MKYLESFMAGWVVCSMVARWVLRVEGERRWWCQYYNEFGDKGSPHPYCLRDVDRVNHMNCGWGTWLPSRKGQR